MYTRNYYDGSESSMPQGYDGIALRPEPRELEPAIEQTSVPFDEKAKKQGNGGVLQGILGTLHLSLPSLDKIGYEEILILGIAAFLFFSADGDKECALILLALLLIN